MLSIEKLVEIGRLDQYEIIEKIGSGGMSTVYRALDTNLNRLVALKVFNPGSDSEILTRFFNEGPLMAGLDDHPNIANVYTAGEDKGYNYIAMEYVKGRTLRKIIKDYVSEGEMMPVDDALKIFKQILEALAYAHDSGIVHRDINPNNIMVTENGEVKVLDFGIAKDLLKKDRKKTDPGTPLGTFSYLSPEQITDPLNIDYRSDQFQAGIVLYELLTGVHPFIDLAVRSGSTYSKAVEDAIEKHNPVFPSKHNPEIPRHLENIMMKMFEKKPDKRYEKVGELLEDLKFYEQNKKISAGGYKLRRGWRSIKKRPIITIGTIALTALLVIGTSEYIDYRFSPAYVMNQLTALEPSQTTKFVELLTELEPRLYEQAKNWNIPKGRFPFAVYSEPEWLCPDPVGAKHDGKIIRIYGRGYLRTNDEELRSLALTKTAEMSKEIGLNYDDGNERILDAYQTAVSLDVNVSEYEQLILEAADDIAGRFDPDHNIIVFKTDSLGNPRIRADWMRKTNILWKAAEIRPDGKYDYAAIARAHIDKSIDMFILPDGTIREYSYFDRHAGEWRVSNYFAPSPDSEFARGNAQVVQSLLDAFRAADNVDYLNIACLCADHYLALHPEDSICFMDISGTHPSMQPDAGADVFWISVLLDLEELTGIKKYGEEAYRHFWYITKNNLNTDPNRDGIVTDCTYMIAEEYEGCSSLIFVDNEYLEILARILERES
ncbi:MAG: serine/threonine-protein kinase [archaeon]